MSHGGVALTGTAGLASTSFVSECDDQQLHPGSENYSALNGERTTIAPAVDGDFNFDRLRRTRNDLDAEKNRLQLLLDLTTQIGPDVELAQLLTTATAKIRRSETMAALCSI
ncbi:MAG TPA: hypothetical protein VGM27_17355 [Acidobacteriaceae bacterium]